MEQQPTPRERLAAWMAAPVPWFEAEVPMRDGVMLAADVYLPAGADAGAPVPAVVLGTPYDKRSPMHANEALMYQARGYAFVAFDVRGRGKSEGTWRAFVHDGRDGYDAVEWTAAQPWCDGNVGTTGLSYSGWNQWATARERPPHLRAMVSSAAAGRWQQEIPYTYGVFQLYFAYWVYATRRRVMADGDRVDWNRTLRILPVRRLMDGLGAVGETWPDMRDHDTLDAFWQHLRLDDHYADIDLPVLHVNGWHDLEDLLGGFAHYEGMAARSPARGRQRLIVGPWPHVGTRWPQRRYGGVDFGPAAALEMDDIHVRFFDRYLRGLDNGIDREPRLRLFEMGTNVWRELDTWPPIAMRDLYLRHAYGRGALAPVAPDGDEGALTYRYDPLDPVTTPLDFARLSFDEPPLDQAYVERRSDVVLYTSAPLDRPLVVAGWPRLELYAATDGDDTDWHVRLTDVHPDGRSLRVTAGCLRAACRDSLRDPSPVTPDAVTRYEIELGPTLHAFLPGHRLRLVVTSSDFPWFARNLNRFGRIVDLDDPRVAHNRVHASPAFPSRLRLPVWREEDRP
jgi:putative CocE/NonD family hydrolase